MRLYGRLVRLRIRVALLRLVILGILLGRMWKPPVMNIAVMMHPMLIRVVAVLVAILIVR